MEEMQNLSAYLSLLTGQVRALEGKKRTGGRIAIAAKS
jgi:hypothetical protein